MSEHVQIINNYNGTIVICTHLLVAATNITNLVFCVDGCGLAPPLFRLAAKTSDMIGFTDCDCEFECGLSDSGSVRESMQSHS